MLNRNSSLTTVLVILLGGVIAFVSAKYLTGNLLSLKSPPDQAAGFDFNLILNSENLKVGPKIGEQVRLDMLKNRDGRSLAHTIADGPAVIVYIDSGCPLCKESADSMRDIRGRLAAASVQYYLVSFGTSDNPADFFKFADSLGTGAPACLWSAPEAAPPKELSEMLIPSHLLIDRNGMIIKKWPGSSASESTRRRMANQIVKDTLYELPQFDSIRQK